MKVVVAIDSFKGSLTSLEAAESIKKGIENACKAEVTISPIADGGEGTVDALVAGMHGRLITSKVTGPLGEKVDASWGIIEEAGHKTAVIEMAAAAGIILIKRDSLNPLFTTTYGVGEIIKEAILQGCRDFIIGIGGSATNDGGAGMLQALGFDLLNADGSQIARGAIGLKELKSISDDNVVAGLRECNFRIACDVKNPLCGDNGCSVVYGPQKGAGPEMIKDMDEWLYNYSLISGGNAAYPGTGAAGGLGYAFLTFLEGELEPGIDIILEATGLEQKIKGADVVVTGEGRMDSQTIMGKVPVGVAAIAKRYNKKVIAFCGCATEDAGICNEYGIDSFFSILRNPVSLEEALDRDKASDNLTKTAEQVFRLYSAGSELGDINLGAWKNVDTTYNDIREKSLMQWLDEIEVHDDIAVRGGVKLVREYLKHLETDNERLQDEIKLKNKYLMKLKERVE